MPTRNVVLTDHQARLVERREAGHAARLRALREAAAAGIADIDAGDFRTFEALEPLRDHLDVLSRMLHDRMDLPSAEVE